MAAVRRPCCALFSQHHVFQSEKNSHTSPDFQLLLEIKRSAIQTCVLIIVPLLRRRLKGSLQFLKPLM